MNNKRPRTSGSGGIGVTKRVKNTPEPLGKLLPKQVDSPPAFYPQRTQFLNVIKDKLVENGYDGRRAIEIEQDLANKTSKYTYPMSIRQKIKEITTKKLDNPEKEADYEPIYKQELAKLVIPVPELAKSQYITEKPDSIPSTDPIVCARCRTKYNPEKPITGTDCRFHLLKRQYDLETKKLSTVFPCCNEPLDQGSGCESRTFHVFKLERPENLEYHIPFRTAPPNKDAKYAIGLDCEMAWTDQGFELIRLSMVDYSTRKILFDRLVWPLGKILDLNTRFSGVRDMKDGTVVDGKTYEALTLDEMYIEMFKLVSSDTILIGHGLQNDLNVLRLIHHKVVDTAMLYPRIRSRTFSLKDLAWDFLSRTIQTGEHSSEEDSLAAIDIIREDIKRRVLKK